MLDTRLRINHNKSMLAALTGYTEYLDYCLFGTLLGLDMKQQILFTGMAGL